MQPSSGGSNAGSLRGDRVERGLHYGETSEKNGQDHGGRGKKNVRQKGFIQSESPAAPAHEADAGGAHVR